jgi:uncharacterized membrane protein YadS
MRFLAGFGQWTLQRRLLFVSVINLPVALTIFLLAYHLGSTRHFGDTLEGSLLLGVITGMCGAAAVFGVGVLTILTNHKWSSPK